nr:zonadhesin-like isoform X2 [Dermatophagoides farinae]
MLLSTIWTMFTLNKNNGVISIRSNTWHSCGVYLTIYLIIFVCFITTGTINANPSPINITTVPETIVEVDIDLNNGVDDNEQLTTTSIPIFETTTSNNEFISSVIDQLNETINGTNSSTLVDDVVVEPYTPKCDPITEVLSNCSNSCPATCEDLDRKPCKNFCWKSCECAPGYVRNYQWKCIAREKCPKCENNEHYRNCGPECEQTCETYQNPPAYCNRHYCKRGCFCNYGFVRDMSQNGTCTPINECPNKCGPNEYWDVNGEPCIRTTEDPRPKCLFEKPVSGCICNTGFVRDPNTKQCQPITTEPIKCEHNETYSQCGSDCAMNCFDHNKRERCPTVCNRGCFCKDGYRRQYSTQRCVLPEDCNNNSNGIVRDQTLIEFA